MSSSRTRLILATVLVSGAFTIAPAVAAPQLFPQPDSHARIVPVQGKPDDNAKKALKQKSAKPEQAKQGQGKSQKAKAESANDPARSNKGGETRAQERADQVQGMQDSGKGPQQRTQNPQKKN